MFTLEKDAIGRATKRLQEVLGDNLVAVTAFGSRARGDFTGESDFDIFIVVKNRDFSVIERVISAFDEEEDRTGVPFSFVIKPLASFEKEKAFNTSFYRNIKKDGVSFYGRT